MNFPFTIVRREQAIQQGATVISLKQRNEELQKENSNLLRENAHMADENAAVHRRTSETHALAADKQREIGQLRQTVESMRRSINEQNELLRETEREARKERQALMDWIAKGVSNGIPIFKELPPPVVDAAEPAPPAPAPGTERVPSDLEDAIRVAGRKPRAIVNLISKKNEVNFEMEMQAKGVRRIFSDDRAMAEAEAVVISEQHTG